VAGGVEAIQAWGEQIRARVGEVLVEADRAVQLCLVGVLARGHVLFEDVPGVGKTRLAQALAACLGVSFQRVQFTPDVLPSDLTGTNVFVPATGDFRFHPGPLFAAVVLADEINRAAPRTQSALLEAMEERQVTVDGVSRPLPAPFLVLATQNPVELEGTFPLPEAQLDRFLLRVTLGYPTLDGERDMLRRVGRRESASDMIARLHPVPAPPGGLQGLGETVRDVRVSDDVADYLLRLVRASRAHPDVRLGASPRAAVAWYGAAQAHAALAGRDHVVPDDVKDLAQALLGHRLVLTTEAQLHGTSAEAVVAEILAREPVPVEEAAGT
jgi:MoxR-like ATPase